MKKLSLLFFCFVTLFAARTASADGLTKVADNVYSYAGVKDASPASSFAANAGIVVGDDGVLVVDTLISAKEADRFIADIRKVTDKPIKYVVNTHYHLDHSFGNAEFGKLGATIVSHEADREALVENGEATLRDSGMLGLTADDLKGTAIALPALTFTDRMTVRLGGVSADLIFVAPSHTKGSILVYIPEKKVLFAGDILFTDFHPYMGEGDLGGWVKCLEYIKAMDVTAIVPGHGPISGKKDVDDMEAYLKLFDSKTRELASRSQDPVYISGELIKTLPARSHLDWMIPFNVKERYLNKGN